MKKEEAFKAMESGAVISHIRWEYGRFIREIDGRVGNEQGKSMTKKGFLDGYEDGWFIVRKDDTISSYQAEQLLKQIPLHLEDPNRVWCYSGHEAEPTIAKAIRALHDEVKRLKGENCELKVENESLKAGFYIDINKSTLTTEQINELLGNETW